MLETAFLRVEYPAIGGRYTCPETVLLGIAPALQVVDFKFGEFYGCYGLRPDNRLVGQDPTNLISGPLPKCTVWCYQNQGVSPLS